MKNTVFALTQFPSVWPIGVSIAPSHVDWIEGEVEEHRFLAVSEHVRHCDYYDVCQKEAA